MSRFESCHLAFKFSLNQVAILRHNSQSFMTYALRKAIMKRTKLGNKLNKEKHIVT